MSYGFLQRLSLSARTSRVEPPVRAPRPRRLCDIAPGSAVVDIAGRRVGKVRAVIGDDLLVDRGWWRGSRTVPGERIVGVHDGVVRLGLLGAELDDP